MWLKLLDYKATEKIFDKLQQSKICLQSITSYPTIFDSITSELFLIICTYTYITQTRKMADIQQLMIFANISSDPLCFTYQLPYMPLRAGIISVSLFQKNYIN